MTCIYWLRNDLRLHDNECLQRAILSGLPLLMVYCFDSRHYRDLDLGFKKTGYLRLKFLFETLQDLRNSCQARGGELLILTAKPENALADLVASHQASQLIYQKEIASEETEVEQHIQTALSPSSCEIIPVWGKTLYHIDDSPFPPEETPLTSKSFRMKLTKTTDIRALIPTPDILPKPPAIDDWGNMPAAADLGFSESEIYAPQHNHYPGGETKALERLKHYTFETQQLTSYRWTRNRSLGMDYSSKFSPWMAVGALSPRQIYWTVKDYESEIKKNISTWWLIFEVVWRDYFKYKALRFGDKMFYSGGIRDRDTSWKYDRDLFEKWRSGRTGIPFVDAHMRELNQTGFMSNRGRVNCASFLTRDYLIDWRWGASWFEHALLDYDVCSNWLNWNTQAMEIYYTNPVHQGKKYDKDGVYVRHWISELIDVPRPIIQAPWLMTDTERVKYNSSSYPSPVEIYDKWTRSINNIKKAHQASLDKPKTLFD